MSARDGRVVYLLDEILQGTNSVERAIAVQAVARHLLAAGAIGVMTTHDLAIAEEEPLRSAAVLVHFTETVDRRWRDGIRLQAESRTSNFSERAAADADDWDRQAMTTGCRGVSTSLQSDLRRPRGNRVFAAIGVTAMKTSSSGSIRVLLSSLAAAAQNEEPGRQTFVSQCAACHGADGNGGERGPAIIARLQSRNDQQLTDLIHRGLPGAGMPGYDIAPAPMANSDRIPP